MKVCLKSKRFWLSCLFVLPPVLVVAAMIYYFGTVTSSHKASVYRHIMEQRISGTDVFVDSIEARKQREGSADILETVKYRMGRLDEEFAINSLVVDSQYNVVTRRVHKEEGFCDPFTTPDNPDLIYEYLSSTLMRGEFSLVCGGETCYWYYRRVELGGEMYTVLVGVQPLAVTNMVDIDAFITPFIIITVFLVLVSNALAFMVVKHGFRDKNARTRREDMGAADGKRQLA